MCGITGLLVAAGRGRRVAAGSGASVASLKQRGPDDTACGFATARAWRSAARACDPRPLAPGPPADGVRGRLLTMVFNGEVYNFAAVRAELDALGHRFRSSGDSEVVLAAFQQWGRGGRREIHRHVRDRPVERARAAHAAARPPRREASLLRVGRQGVLVRLGAEGPARLPRLEAEIDRDALGEYLQYGYVSAPRSIYRDVRKLPGHWMELGEVGEPAVREYWSPSTTSSSSRATGELRAPPQRQDDRRLPPAHRLGRPGGRVHSGRHGFLRGRRDPAEARRRGSAHLHHRIRRPALRRGAGRPLFKAMGIGLADLAIARLAVERSIRDGRGANIAQPQQARPRLRRT